VTPLAVQAATIGRKSKGPSTVAGSAKVDPQRVDKEKRYGTVRRSGRVSGTQESGTISSGEDEPGDAGVIADDEAEDDRRSPPEPADEEMVEAPPSNKQQKRGGRLHPRWADEYETPRKVEEAYDRLMKNEIKLQLQDLLAFRGNLGQMLSRRRPLVNQRHGGDDFDVTEVVDIRAIKARERREQAEQMLEDLATIAYACGLTPPTPPSKTSSTRPLSIHQVRNVGRSNVASSAMHTPKVHINVNSCNSIVATLDSGAEVNVMSRTIAEESKLVIENRNHLSFRGITGSEKPFFGICRRVRIEVGSCVSFVDFLVIDGDNESILLGFPFFIETELSFQYNDDGKVRAIMKDSTRRKQVTVTVAGDAIDLVSDAEK
jgi:hypothetical protein